MKLGRKKSLIILAIVGLLALSPLLVLAHPRARAALRLTPGFEPLERDPRVFFEPGAEALAERIADALPAAVARVEACQVLPLEPGFRVYVCASHESFSRHIAQPVGFPVRGIAFPWDIWVSPKAFAFFGRDTHRQTLVHELSHLHLGQHLGWWRRIRRIPSWFAEGLADWVADTGGERVSRDTAVQALSSGHHLVPDTSGRLLLPKRPRDHGLTWPMFHRQSRMFVEYMRDRDEQGFTRFVADLLGGARFDAAFGRHFDDSLDGVWRDFLGSLESEP